MQSLSDVHLLKTIQEIQSQFIEDADPRVVFDNLLRHLLELTGSPFGFVGEVLRDENGRPYLKTQSVSDLAWDDASRALVGEDAAKGLEFRNLDTLFGAVIRSGEPVIANDPPNDPRSGGLPSGHPALHSFLGMPLLRRDRLVGMVGLANRTGGYDVGLIDYLQPMLTTCASIINASSNARRRRNAEAALRDSEQRYRSLVEDQPELICRFRRDGTLTFVNRAYANYFGRRLSECIGLDLYELMPESDRDAMRRHVASMGTHQPIARIEHQVIAYDGEIRWMQWTDRLLFDDDGNPSEFQSIGLDITDRKRAEEERDRFETRIQQVQKLESLGILAGGIAHDFNNLLTGILGNANLLIDQFTAGSNERSGLEQIEHSARRAAELCMQMLAYSGKGRFITTVADLSDLVHEMVQMLEVSISKKATLELDLASSLPPVEADVTQIRQVVMNLITNASDALGDAEGAIQISTGSAVCDRDQLRGTFLDDELDSGVYVHVEVTDTGCGMEPDTVAKIFDPFFTTKFAGRGLGLAAVLGIVRGHRGAIDVQSRPGRGTTVRAMFPAAAATAVKTDVDNAEAPPARGTGTILVADDEAVVRSLMERTLHRFGYVAVTAVDGREALELFRREPDRFSAVVLDLTMPHQGGEEVFREMSDIRPGTRVILTSGFSEQDATQRFAGLGLAGFLQKPFRPRELMDRIDEALGR